MKPKIAIIGGGSFQWAPKFMMDMALSQDLRGSEIFLNDIDKEALELSSKVGSMIMERAGSDIAVYTASGKEEALDAADFVILTISTGGLKAMAHDVKIPKKYGIHHTVGDTCGPGGISRSLRNIPVVVDIAKMMERLCPSAYLMNYTNPLTTLTRAVRRETSIKCVGFCHELFGTRNHLKIMLDVDDDSEMEMEVCGINHLPWLLGLKIKGEDAFPKLRKYIDENEFFIHGEKSEDPIALSFSGEERIKFQMFRAFGAYPVAGDRHLAEFFPYFLTEKSGWGEEYGVRPTLIEYRHKLLEDDKQRLEKICSGENEIEVKSSGEDAASFIADVVNDRKGRHILNIPNDGAIPGIMDDAIIEIFGDVDASGIKGVRVTNLPLPVAAILKYHISVHELTVEAAITGDRSTALQAFLLDPMMREFNDAEKLMDEMLEANREYLPRFFQ